MKNVYVVADNIFSPLGKDTDMNMTALKEGRTGIRQHHAGLAPEAFYASLFSPEEKSVSGDWTDFEQVAYTSAFSAVQIAGLNPADKKTGFILSTTKGNIGLIEKKDQHKDFENRVSLNTSASRIASKLGISTEPLVISHACISGLLAIITATRLIRSGIYDTIVVTGADMIGSFIYSGFRSFQAISPNPCKPFDATRDGITLGEAAATVILSVHKKQDALRLAGGSVSNDANHISGPSRTGEELWMAIRSAMNQSGVKSQEIDFISAHGTATRYNDEMEAKAMNLAALQAVPLNSLKGYYGHTLGAAGILESIITIHSMKENLIIPTKGYSIPGTEMPVNIVSELQRKNIHTALKTASGFGGCNAALVLMHD